VTSIKAGKAAPKKAAAKKEEDSDGS
jgi:hypothetical protein